MSGQNPLRPTGLGSVWGVVLTLALALPGRAQAPPVDELVRLALAPKPSYTMTADFDVFLSIRYGSSGGLLTATAQGLLTEWHTTGEPLHRMITIREIWLPFMLRPFTGLIQRVIKERIETQPDDLPDFHVHDFFLLGGAPESRYVIGGLRRDIVTQTMARYRASRFARDDDTDTRRAIAKWLFTSPLMKSWIVRPGPPYALEAVVDARGLLYTLTIFYDWGAVTTQIAYAFINGQPVWNRVRVDAAGELPTLGRVTGQVTISLSNQCFDCTVTGSAHGASAAEKSQRHGPIGKRPPEDRREPVRAEDEGCGHARRRNHDGDAARRQPLHPWHPLRRRETGRRPKTGLPGSLAREVVLSRAVPVDLPRRHGPSPAVAISLSPRERIALERVCRAGTTERRLADRAQAILLAAAGWGNAHIATYLHRSRYWVQRWRRRFDAERLAGLSDRRRTGRPPRPSPL
ncbi:MAG TPA: helix-turn-helix domain-containing protein [bacterium]|nr:helix-turn-helix domain-containing protein [bacterium]